MPSFAPFFTPRYKVKYRSAGFTHNLLFRGFRGESAIATVSRGVAAAEGIASACASILATDFAWISAVYIPEDTNGSVVAALPAAVAGTVPLANTSKEDGARYLKFQGRSEVPGGSPVTCELFGVSLLTDDTGAAVANDFIVTSAESAIVANAVLALNAANVTANDNNLSSWYEYANVKVNDYWVRQIRKGA